jgi:hypothetical protein
MLQFLRVLGRRRTRKIKMTTSKAQRVSNNLLMWSSSSLVEIQASPSAQKLLLHEILSVEPAIQRLLKYSEVPISFSMEDQWTCFSEPGKYPLVLDPVVHDSKLTRVLIDDGSRLILIFTYSGEDEAQLPLLENSTFVRGR